MDLEIGNGITIGQGITINFVSTTAPVNVILPVVSGNAKVRETLTTTNGKWTPGVPAPITGYAYQWQASNSNIVSATSNSYTIPYTLSGQPIRSGVIATNSSGSNIAYSLNTVNVVANTPLAPTSVVATAISSSSANVTFIPPVDTGGATITNYIVTSSPGNITANSSSTTITVAGLTAKTTYTFTVKAENSAGIGPASAPSNAVTPIPYIGEFFGGGYFLSDNGATYTVVGPVANETTGNGVQVLNAYFSANINGYTGWDSGTLGNWDNAFTYRTTFANISQGFANTQYWTGVEVLPFSTDKMYYKDMNTGITGQAFKYSQSPYNGPIYRGRPFRTAAW